MPCEKKWKHDQHICVLSEKGELDLVHRLALEPTFQCNDCGAKTNDPERVCDPILLPDITWLGDGGDVKL